MAIPNDVTENLAPAPPPGVAASVAHGPGAGVLARRRLAPLLSLLAVPALLDPGVVARLDALRDASSGGLTLSQQVLAHLWAPVVAMSAAVLLLAPGLVLAFPRRGALDAGTWLVRGAAFSIGVLAVVVPAVEAVAPAPLRGRAFGVVVLALALGLMGARMRVATDSPGAEGGITGRPSFLFSLLLVPALLGALLAGKLFWESLNGDGAHAYESARLLLHRALPFWPEEAGPIASFPGLTSFVFAFPASWYLRLFGEYDAAARLPFLMFLGLLGATLCTFVVRPWRREAAPWLIWAGLLPYAAAMVFSATYNPYAADIALPATQDTLLMVFALGAVAAWERSEWGWLAAFTALTVASLPNGFILIGLLAVAPLLIERPRRWRRATALIGILLLCLVVVAMAPALLRLAGQPAPGDEYGIIGLLRYFAFLQVSDWHRVLYVAIPCGLAPVVTALRWRRLDTLARTMVIMAGAYFAFFFVQAYTALHHYVPTVLLLLAAHWRALSLADPVDARRWLRFTAAGGVAALALAMPRHATPHRDGERVGQSIVARVGDYAESDPEVFRASTLLNALFPYDWAPEVPEVYGGSPLVWIRYARHGAAIDETTNYVLQSAGLPPPPGMREVARDEGAALYVRSDGVWNTDRSRRPATEPGSRWLNVPRGVLFRTEPRGDASRVIEVLVLLERAGIDVDALLARLGVSR